MRPLRRLAYRLAWQTGCVDVDAMLASLTVRQIVEWCAFLRIEPGGESVLGRRLGTMLAVWAGAQAGEHYGPEDFFPELAEPDDDGEDRSERTRALFDGLRAQSGE
jgi:hypothetical protein